MEHGHTILPVLVYSVTILGHQITHTTLAASELIIIVVLITISGTASAVIGVGHLQALSAPMITTLDILEPILAAEISEQVIIG